MKQGSKAWSIIRLNAVLILAALFFIKTASATYRGRRVLVIPNDVAPLTPPSVPADSAGAC